jgi:hypothetical protein
MESIVFAVTRNPGEGYTAVAEGDAYSLVTEGTTLDELEQMIRDVVAAFFVEPAERPRVILWRFETGLAAA